MKKIVLAVMMFALLMPAFAQQAEQQPPRTGTFRFSLEDCLEYAMGNSYQREQMELNQQTAQINYDQSKLDRLPNLTGSVSESFSHSKGSNGAWGGSYGVNTGMTLFQGGTLNKTVRQNELYVGQAQTRTAQFDNTLAIDILSSFFTILGYEELLKYQHSLIEESQAQVNDGRVRYENQTILESDYLMLESQLASNLNNITETQISLDNELLNLKSLLSLDTDADLSIVSPDTTAFMSLVVLPEQNEYLEMATATLPDLELLDYAVDIAESTLKISKSAYSPTLSLSGSLSTGHSQNFQNWGTQVGDRFSQGAGVSLSIPIFNRNRTKSNVAKNRIALQQAELERKQGELDIHQSLIRNYRNAESALSKYRMMITREKAYRETLRVYNAQFGAGSIKPVDLLQQQNNYISVMYDYVQSKYDFMLRRKMLDVYMGLEITM